MECIKINNVNNQFLLSLSIIALGYIFKRFDIIKEKDADGISRIIFNITLPALIMNTFNSIKIDNSLIFVAIISITYGLFMSVLGIFIFRKEPRSMRGTLTMLVPGFNVGLFAYPLVEAIWGSDGLKYFGMFDMGNSIPVFAFCYLIASYFSSDDVEFDYRSIAKKLVTSIPLMSYIITLSINLLGFHYPSPVIAACQILSKANMALSLLLLGICLNFSINKAYWKNIMKVLVTRYGVGLAVATILFAIFPLSTFFHYTLLIGLTLPIGMAVVPYSVQFNYDTKFVGTICSMTIVLSFLLTWLIVTFL